MAISNRDISGALASYLERYPEEAAPLSEPMRLLSQGGDFASRRSFPMHVTAGALLVRGAEILLVEHRAYGIVLQPGGHPQVTVHQPPGNSNQSALCPDRSCSAAARQARLPLLLPALVPNGCGCLRKATPSIRA